MNQRLLDFLTTAFTTAGAIFLFTSIIHTLAVTSSIPSDWRELSSYHRRLNVILWRFTAVIGVVAGVCYIISLG